MDTLTRTAMTGSIDLAVRSSGPVGDTPVLLIHGMGGDHHTWRSLARLLRATGRGVISLDLRGHGRSSRSESYLLEDFSDDVSFVLDDLGIDHVDVVGHSLGAHTAMRVAMSAPDRVGKLVLEEIPPMPRSQADVDENIAPFTGIGDRVRGVWTMIRYPGPVFRFDNQMSEIVTRQFDVVDTGWWDALSTITAPTLVISGGARSFLPPRHLESVAGALPDSDFISIDAGHSVHRDRPREFNTRVVDFLQP